VETTTVTRQQAGLPAHTATRIVDGNTVTVTKGEGAAYPYASGKPKFSQAANGVQTCHEYEATSEHGAVHKHTSITKADGELVAGQSRKSEEFIAAYGTVTFERKSVWDGSAWLLLDSAAYEYDGQQRVIKTTRGNGRVNTKTWMCCSVLSEPDEDGVRTDYAYDNIGNRTLAVEGADAKDEFMANGYETIKHFANAFAVGSVLATAYGLTFDQFVFSEMLC